MLSYKRYVLSSKEKTSKKKKIKGKTKSDFKAKCCKKFKKGEDKRCKRCPFFLKCKITDK